jgi:hypothetical protein
MAAPLLELADVNIIDTLVANNALWLQSLYICHNNQLVSTAVELKKTPTASIHSTSETTRNGKQLPAARTDTVLASPTHQQVITHA